MAVSDQAGVMQIVRDESNPFGDEQENIFVHQLQKFNESLEVLRTDMHSSSNEKLGSDSLQAMNVSERLKPGDLLADRLGQPDLSLFAGAPQPLSINPNAMNVSSARTGLPSPVYSDESLWSGQTKLPFSSVSSVDAIAQCGQFTPPDDSPQEQSAFDDKIERHDSLRPSIEGAEDATFSHHSPASVQDDESKVKSKSGSLQPRKRRRKSCKAESPEEDQKREEFLARNRVAASKSRQKKKEWTQSLERQLKVLQDENQHLTYAVTHLRDEIIAMKTLCLSHVECDCSKIRDYMSQTLELSAGPGRRMSTLSTPASSSQLGNVARDNANTYSGRFRTQSIQNFSSASQSPISGRQGSTFDMSSPPGDGPRSRVNSSTTVASSIHPLHEAAATKIEGPFSRHDAFESPKEPALPFGDDLNDSKDIDMSAMWEETVGGGDYITGAATER